MCLALILQAVVIAGPVAPSRAEVPEWVLASLCNHGDDAPGDHKAAPHCAACLPAHHAWPTASSGCPECSAPTTVTPVVFLASAQPHARLTMPVTARSRGPPLHG